MPVSKSKLPAVTDDALLLSAGQAARLLGVSPNTLAKMIRDGEIAAVMSRSRWVITRAEVDRYVREIASAAELARLETAQ